MGLPTEPLTLSPQHVRELSQKLGGLRHNVNNHLSLMIAAAELVRRKPDLLPRMLDTLSGQPHKILAELKQFSDDFESTLGITRD